MAREYTCEYCGGTFESGWSDEEATAERDRLWSKQEMAEGQAVLCEECFQEFMAWLKANPQARIS